MSPETRQAMREGGVVRYSTQARERASDTQHKQTLPDTRTPQG